MYGRTKRRTRRTRTIRTRRTRRTRRQLGRGRRKSGAKKSKVKKSKTKKKKTKKKKAKRKGPAISATKCKVGEVREGNDKNMWKVKKTKNGVKRWMKMNSA